jgi:O-antigen ligase
MVFCAYNYRSGATSNSRTYLILCLMPVALFLLNVIGLSYSESIDIALSLALRKIHLFLIPVGFLLLDKRKFQPHVRNVVLSIFLAMCFLSSFACIGNAIVNMIQAESLSFFAAGKEHFYFTSHAFASPLRISAVYLSMYYCVAFLIVLNGELIANRVLKFTLCIYLVIMILVCASTAGILCMLFVFLLWLIQTRNRKLLLLSSAAIFFGIAAVTLMNASWLSNKAVNALKFTYTYEDGSLSPHTGDRLVIWQASLNAIRERWLFGHGTAAGQKALEEVYEEKGLEIELRDELNPHNQFISTTLDFGLAGVVTLFATLLMPLFVAVRSRSFMMAGLIVVMMVFFCAESVLLRQKGIVFFSFFYCFLIPAAAGPVAETKKT